MTSRGHGPRPEDPEEDPTGVRELLSGLPDPGPMPDHVAARIAATIEGHDQQRARVRSSFPRQQILLVAAAGVVGIGVVGAVVYERAVDATQAPQAAVQNEPTDHGQSEYSSATESSSEESSADSANSSELPADSRPPALDAVATLDERTFAVGAGAVLEGAMGETPPSLPAAFEVIDAEARALPPQETENCVRATGESPEGSGWVAAPATVAQMDVVVVSDRAASAPQAWAVSAECVTDASAAVLHGPTDLP